MFTISGISVLLGLLVVAPASVQIGSGTSASSFSESSVVSVPVVEGFQRNEPHTLVQQTTTVRTLGDGTHITTVREEIRIRDAEGRTRTEITRNGSNPVPLTFVQILDPVAHTWASLDIRNKVAHINHMPVPTAPSPEQQAQFAATRAQTQAARAAQAGTESTAQGTQKVHRDVEVLTPRTIAGVLAEGRRITRTIPAGKEGNDRDLTITTETWTSPELRVSLERTTDDPRTGKVTMVTMSLERASPDPALLQIPADYKVIDQQHATSP